jgi:catechol 2,3-dioxygenase-like lactoylglutathione lyase family enzyme
VDNFLKTTFIHSCKIGKKLKKPPLYTKKLPSCKMPDLPKELARTGYAHIAFSVGSKEKVDALTVELKTAGYEVISDPRTTGDGYYESCIVAIEGNQIEVTV